VLRDDVRGRAPVWRRLSRRGAPSWVRASAGDLDRSSVLTALHATAPRRLRPLRRASACSCPTTSSRFLAGPADRCARPTTNPRYRLRKFVGRNTGLPVTFAGARPRRPLLRRPPRPRALTWAAHSARPRRGWRGRRREPGPRRPKARQFPFLLSGPFRSDPQGSRSAGAVKPPAKPARGGGPRRIAPKLSHGPDPVDARPTSSTGWAPHREQPRPLSTDDRAHALRPLASPCAKKTLPAGRRPESRRAASPAWAMRRAPMGPK